MGKFKAVKVKHTPVYDLFEIRTPGDFSNDVRYQQIIDAVGRPEDISGEHMQDGIQFCLGWICRQAEADRITDVLLGLSLPVDRYGPY